MNGCPVDVVEAVHAHAGTTGNRIAMIGADDRAVTYADLDALVRRGAGALAAHGLRPGDGVLFAVRPSPDAVVAALAVVAAGGIVIVADPGAGQALSGVRLAAARPRWSMAEPLVHLMTTEPAQRLLARRGLSLPDLRAPGLRHVLVGGPRRLPRWLLGAPRGALRWDALLHRPSGPNDLPAATLGATALVVFTSGTTAAPRAVMHTRGTLAAGAHALLQRLELVPRDVVHTDQLMLGLPVLAAGATWSFAPLGADGPTWRRTAAARGATVGYAVPATLDQAAAAGPRPDTLRLLVTGGAPVTPAVVRRLQVVAPRARVVAVYGLTEALPVATADGEELLQHARHEGSGLLLGRPVGGSRVGVDTGGELWVSGPQVTPGYLGQAPGDRIRTGDLARVLPDGRLELLGRAKDMLLRGVTNIYPALVEPLVEAEPGVLAAAMVGLPDPRTGDEQVVLVLVPEPGTDGAALRRKVERRLPALLDAAWLPDHVLVQPDLPRVGRSAKVDKAVLRKRVRGCLGVPVG